MNRLIERILFPALFIGTVCASGTLLAQGFYSRVGLGYAFPQAAQTMDGTATPFSGTSNNTTIDSIQYTSYKVSRVSFMQGLHATLAGGYMFNKNVGIDLAMTIGMSMSQTIYNDDSVTISNAPANVQVVQKAQSPIMIMPSLVLQTGGEKTNIYTRVGIVLPLRTAMQYDQIFTFLPAVSGGTSEVDDYAYTLKNSFSLGMTAAVGAQFSFSNTVRFYVEANFMSLSVFAKQAVLNSVTVDGSSVDQSGNPYINQIPVDQRNIAFSKNFNAAAGDPNHLPTYSLPFSNVGIHLGMMFLLGDQGERASKSNSHSHTKRYSDEDHINRF